MRNKKYGFTDKHMDGRPRARASYSSLRPNGTINTRPQDRMRQSQKRGKHGENTWEES